MNQERLIECLFQALVTGNRRHVREMTDSATADGVTAEEWSHQVLWPILETITQLYRADQMTRLAHHYSTRLLRTLVDQSQLSYERKASRNRRIVMFCGESAVDGIAGHLAADLVEADGYEVYFSGGGIANDEILAEVGEHRPDILLMFGSAPADAPNIRVLVDHIREVGACPEMQIVVGGGIFNRAEGLAEEIGADLWVKTPGELIERLESEADRRATPEQRTVGRHRAAGGQATQAA